MSTFTFRLLLALIGLFAFAALLVTSVTLAKSGQPVWAAFTGAGAVTLAVGGLYRLLLLLGQRS